MGIRFSCHHCSYAINVKDFQGGKRGKCPSCKGSFRIPFENATYSLVVEEELVAPSSSTSVSSAKQAVNAVRRDLEQSDAPEMGGGVVADRGSEKKTSVEEKPEIAPGRSVSGKAKSTSSREKPIAVDFVREQPTGASKLRPSCIAFEAAPGASWFVRPPSGGQYGPADDALLTQWIEESRVTPESLLWREGLSQWVAARELLPELYRVHPPTPLVPPVAKPGVAPPDRSISGASPLGASKKKESPGPVLGSVSPDLLSEDAAAMVPGTGQAISTRYESVETKVVASATILAQRKVRRRRQQWYAIVSLGVVSVLLLVGLVVVLVVLK